MTELLKSSDAFSEATVLLNIIQTLTNRLQEFRIPLGNEDRLVVAKMFRTRNSDDCDGWEIELAVDKSFRYTGFMLIYKIEHYADSPTKMMVDATELNLKIFEPTTMEEAEHHLMLIRLMM